MKALVNMLIVVVAILSGGPPLARSEPLALLRQLQDIQESGALEPAKPSGGRRDEIVSLIRSSLQSGDKGWSDPRNIGAIALFLLTGGDPQLLRQARLLMPRDSGDSLLIQHALAYADGQMSPDARQLEKISARMASPEVGGALALIQARLSMERDRALASERSLTARILAPGGLIEEAALRQELLMADWTIAHQALERITARYFSRFHRSVYAESFAQRLENLLEEMWSVRVEGERAALAPLLDGFPIAIRRRIAMRIARWSLLHGDGASARGLVDGACTNLDGEVDLEERCDLYRQIGGMFVLPGDDKSTSQSRRLHLNDEDRLLLECATLIKALVGHTREMRQDEGDQEETETMRLARTKIVEADQLLAGIR